VQIIFLRLSGVPAVFCSLFDLGIGMPKCNYYLKQWVAGFYGCWLKLSVSGFIRLNDYAAANEF